MRSLLFVPADGGSKLDKAQRLKVRVLDEGAFARELADLEGSAGRP